MPTQLRMKLVQLKWAIRDRKVRKFRKACGERYALYRDPDHLTAVENGDRHALRLARRVEREIERGIVKHGFKFGAI